MKWLTPSFWGYVLSRPERGTESWPIVAACRLRGHDGEIYFNPGGTEPDHRCRRCLEVIG